MEKENLKIETYEKGVSSLPDYPSDSGYTAEMLKSVFDSRSDNEIKEKHNALTDAVADETARLSQEIEEHKNDKSNPHGITLESLGYDGAGTVKRVLGSSNLASIVPKKDEFYVIEYIGVQMPAESGGTFESEVPMYVLKVGNGKDSLDALPSLYNTVAGVGDGSVVQFIESELSKVTASGGAGVATSARPTVTGKASSAFGRYHKVYGRESMAVNYNNEIRAKNAFAANSGNCVQSSAEGAFVAGHGNEANSPYQAVFGTYGTAGTNDAFIVGNGNSDADRRNAFRVDRNGLAEAEKIKARDAVECKSIKVENGVSAKSVSATGKSQVGCLVIGGKEANFAINDVRGEGSAAFGGSNKIYGRNGFTLLTSNTIAEEFESVLIAGHNNTATASHQYIFGTYSDPKSTDLFIIGNGDAKRGKLNALVLERAGNLRISGSEITLGKTVITEDDAAALIEPDKTIVKHTIQEYRYNRYTEEESKLPISAGAVNLVMTSLFSQTNLIQVYLDELKERVAALEAKQ